MIEAQHSVLDTSLKGDGRHHYKVCFQYNGQEYNLSLTDPKYRNEDFDGIRIPSATYNKHSSSPLWRERFVL